MLTKATMIAAPIRLHAMRTGLDATNAALTISDGQLPATINFKSGDDGCVIDCRPSVERVRPRVVLSNSSGFGGINAALVLQEA